MKTVKYKNMDYPIEIYNVANMFAVNSKLINEILDTYTVYFIKSLHYMIIDEKVYLTRVGIIRMAMLVGTVEAMDFALHLERELAVFQNSYEKMKINYEDIFRMKDLL